jgi:hypothetical protein
MSDSVFDLCVVGDLQETSYLEFWRERNDPERRRILAKIQDLRPTSCVLLGDMVLWGRSESCWLEVDTFLGYCRDKSITVYPVIGNHEYWGDSRLTGFSQRFPMTCPNGYAFETPIRNTKGKLGNLVLNSNRSRLGSHIWQIQLDWYRAQLTEYERDSCIRGVLVFCHHPPFTNSDLNTQVSGDFLRDFFKSRKTLAWLSGHVHTYERFQVKGKTFIVSGGGGGPRRPVIPNRNLTDQFKGDRIRPFHFLGLKVKETQVSISVLGLDKAAVTFHPLERVILPYP